jgi:hypothetical protein
VPYLFADPLRVAQWRERIGAAGFKIGIVWQGSRNRIDVGRSVGRCPPRCSSAWQPSPGYG